MLDTWNRALRFLPFLALATALDAAMSLYLYRRLCRPLRSRPLRRALAVAVALLGGLMLLGPVSQRAAPAPWKDLFAQVGYAWMGLSFYLFVCVGALDIALLAISIQRRAARGSLSPREPASPERRALLLGAANAGAVALATGVVGHGVWSAFAPPRITEVAVKLPRLPAALRGMSIVQLTDIHLGVWLERRYLEELVARANSLKPDLVAITGDLVDGSVERLGPIAAALRSLRSRYGTYFVTGNHEYYSGATEWAAALRGMGISVLRNARASIGDVGASLDLVGVDDWGAARQGFGRGYDLGRALSGRDPERAAVLLSHQPRGFEQAAAQGIGLQLSGHTHGGQVWPWTYMVSMAYHPYVAGLHLFDKSAIYVSNGCGFWGPPLRVAAPPELVKVVLT